MSMSRAKNFGLEVAEWNKVYDMLYHSDEREDKEWALRRIALWRARFPRIPTGMDVTERLMRAILKATDIETEKLAGFVTGSSSEIADAHSALGFAIIRFVNLITDLNQKGATQRPVHTAAKEFNIPSWIVELRHDAAHSGVPSVYRLLDAARYCVRWLEEKYWAEERPALAAKLDSWSEREVDVEDDDGVEEVNPNEELLEKYVEIVDERLGRGEDPGARDAKFDSLIESLTMAVSQNTDEFVDIVLRPGFFFPTLKQAVVDKDVNFKRWIPLLEAMYNATLYSLPLVLERLLNNNGGGGSASSRRPAHTERSVAQWFLFIVRHVARRRLAAAGAAAPEEPAELNLPPDVDGGGGCRVVTVDHDLPVNWDWLLQLAVRFPHGGTRHYLPVLCHLTGATEEKRRSLERMLESFLAGSEDGGGSRDVDKNGDDVEKDAGKDGGGGSGDSVGAEDAEVMDDDDCGWEPCSDKLPWKSSPLGTIPGKDLCTLPLEIDWVPA